MSSAISTAPKLNRPNIVAVGTIVWLSSELMFFAALFAMYFTTRAVQGPEIWAEGVEMLNIPFSALNTTVLVLSSVTCQFGVFAAERFQNARTGSLLQFSKWGMREWFALTFAMGAFFIGGQVYEYAELVHEGLTISSAAYDLPGPSYFLEPFSLLDLPIVLRKQLRKRPRFHNPIRPH
ncbi:MAG: hypothetical protein EB099_00550 [Actinobacteria bacterium]|nr:hypothetical protein [Actinomycetota bacterium]